MASTKFKFVSPGIFLNEIDNSNLPDLGTAPGPVLIGRFERGPAMRPVRVNSFSELVEIFGNPLSGKGGGTGDVWRDGGAYLAPTYAAYAAQAWLKNNSPCTVIRLLGTEDPNAANSGTDGPAQAGGKAGWDFGDTGASSFDGAYGLFVFPEGAVPTTYASAMTGTLAAVFYTNPTGRTILTLSGNCAVAAGKTLGATTQFPTASHGVLIGTSSANANGEFKMMIGTKAQIDAGTPTAASVVFNFDENSDKFIRKVFNTNPAKVNSNAFATTKDYFLGETYEREILDQHRSGQTNQHGGRADSSAGKRSSITLGGTAASTGLSSLNSIGYGAILPLKLQGAAEFADRRRPMQHGRTGWFVAQDQGAAADFNAHSLQKLFRLHTMEAGEWTQRNLKVSLQDIKPPANASTNLPQFATFTVVIRKIDDSDGAPQIVERFSGCDLNPNSVNYIARKIGDKYVEWDNDKRAYRSYGTYSNASKFAFVEVNEVVSNGDAAGLIPVGFYGPPRPADIIPSGGIGLPSEAWVQSATASAGGFKERAATAAETAIITTGADLYLSALTCSLIHPQPVLRYSNVQDNLPKRNMSYFGISVAKSGSSNFAPSTVDLLRAAPQGIGTFSADGSRIVTEDSTHYEPAFIFTLDNLHAGAAASSKTVTYISGSRTAGNSISAVKDLNSLLTGSDYGYNRFTTLFHGGSDGLDIGERDPFRNTRLDDSSDPAANSALFSCLRAIDTARDPEVVESNLLAIPGITNTVVTDKLIEVAEERADSLAIIDLENDYIPSHENTSTEASRKADPDLAITSLRARTLNSSYAAAYYPYVQIRDTLSNQLLDVPPSVVALGTLSYSEAVRDPWFAPAGFTRGGLSDGRIGFPVTNVKHQLTSEERDNLYEVNVNPIASFPAEGIVVFGQKTLQLNESALNRINVRRLLLFLKREISRLAATTLFEQNLPATWTGFSTRAEALLSEVKGRLGLADYKVVLDETTTTPDMVDRNIMYAKIFLKPVQAIEFIALDFVITDSGAGFAD